MQQVREGRLTEMDGYKVFGRLCIRAILFVLKKLKEGPEQSTFTSFAGIKTKLKDEIKLLCDGRGKLDKLQPELVPEAIEAAMGSNTMADLQDPQFLAKRAGFEIGKLYNRKADGVIFRIVAMDSAIKLQEVGLKDGDKQIVECTFDDIAKKFGVFKGKLQVKLEPTEMPHKALALKQDLLRAKVFELVMDGSWPFRRLKIEHRFFTGRCDHVWAGRACEDKPAQACSWE